MRLNPKRRDKKAEVFPQVVCFSETYTPFSPSGCVCAASDLKPGAPSDREITKVMHLAVAPAAFPPASHSQTLCPQHSLPSQTGAPVSAAGPSDHCRLGTGRGENRPALLFQQVWITDSKSSPAFIQ